MYKSHKYPYIKELALLYLYFLTIYAFVCQKKILFLCAKFDSITNQSTLSPNQKSKTNEAKIFTNQDIME